jgi:hypothetical protein
VLFFCQEGLFHESPQRTTCETPSASGVGTAEMFNFFSAPAQRFLDGTINAF